MSNPNEAGDVEPKRTLMHGLTTGRAYLKPEYAEAALAEYAAQQNAALLRELQKEEGYMEVVSDGETLLTSELCIPASILEAKLKAIEEAYGR